MKYLSKIGLSVLVLLLIITCNKDETIVRNAYIIEFGTMCGWCAGMEFITISGSNIEYKKIIPCGENNGITNKNILINQDEWEEIVSLFDYSQFLLLDYNECNICVDGCDEIIKITKDGNIHEIRYSPTTEIDEIKNLQQKLYELIEEIRPQN